MLEEQIWSNLHNPSMTVDRSGITYTHLNLEVKSSVRVKALKIFKSTTKFLINTNILPI